MQTRHAPEHSDRTWLTATIAVLLATLAFRLAALAYDGLELYVDEAQYWAWSRHLDFGYFSKPGMIAWVIGASTAVCGDGTACVRLPAPLLHTATALVLFVLGRRLYDARVGFWSAIGYALMPAVAFSSLLISTDVPLLLFWSLGLVGMWSLYRHPTLRAAILTGLAIALGINAKYAMIYLPLASLAHGLASRQGRERLKGRHFWIAVGIGLAGFLPNLYWNMTHDFVTFHHTEGNTGLAHAGLKPGQTLEFLVSQLGIAGPILLMAALALFVPRFKLRRERQANADRFLVWHSLPIIAVVAANSLFGGMNANWAATAFPAVVVLGTAVLLRAQRKWLYLSVATGVVATLVIGLGAIAFRWVEPPKLVAQAKRMIHWNDLGRELVAAAPADRRVIVMDGRMLAAEGLYILRDTDFTVKAFMRAGTRPEDHFQMTIPWTSADTTPVLLLSDSTPEALGIDPRRARPIRTIESGVYPARGGHLILYEISPPTAPAG
ncbi:ArnT family glycosyltransferase [Oryzibacter oryziterrae]|uniref:ArnT family glycosyltransferase n=1 Tax=Oryzibacter oryziterrae TaxID=2766474 RepID=UPI001F21ED1F|nr:glycosyltransferase family 39 protein [Oryzibacter oryziterrae]